MKSKILTIVMFCFTAITSGFSQTHTVTTVNDNGAGSLRLLITNASAGDTIRFSPFIDGDTIKLTSGQIILNKDLVIQGNGVSNTIIDGLANSRIIEVLVNKTVLIENLTIRNGKVTNLTTSKTSLGGGIYNEGHLKIVTVNILANIVESIDGITLAKGGGIYSKNGTLEITNTKVAGNTVTVTSNASSPSSQKVEAFGGGIYVNNDLIVKNSIISGNLASSFTSYRNNFSFGGAIYFEQGNHQLTNTTIAGNSVEAISTGPVFPTLFADGIFANAATLLLRNSIIALNSNDYYLSGSSTLTGSNNHIFSYPNGTNLSSGHNIDPLFVLNVPVAPSTGGDLRLQGCSTDINTGTVDTTGLYLGLVDIADNPRVFDDRIDKGAFEFPFLTSSNSLLVTNNRDKSCGSLRYVVANAVANDTIRFSQAINGQSIKLATGQILIDKPLVIIGNGKDSINIDAQGLGRIFEISASGSLVIDSLSLQNGDVSGNSSPNNRGGAIYTNGDLTLNNVQIKGSKANFGGAIGVPDISQADIFINNCTFSENEGINAAGAFYFIGDTLSISSSTFNDNHCTSTSGVGGAIYPFTLSTNTIIIDNSTFSANSTLSLGGAIFMVGGNMKISNSTFFENFSQYGGGLSVAGTGLEIQNSIFKNTATINGNDINKISGTITSLGNNIVYSATGGHGIIDGNGLDPLLLPLANNGGLTQTHAIPCTSPAYNAGVGISIDQRGKAVFGGIRDIGAFEYQSSVAGLSLSVLNPISTGPETKYAEIIEGESIISSASLISFDAVRYINLKPGFQASNNALFEAKIVSGCD